MVAHCKIDNCDDDYVFFRTACLFVFYYTFLEFPDDINPVTKERGGPKGPEPTRYGDWERKGRCIDF